MCIRDRGGSNSHGAIVGLAMDLPTIVDAPNATQILRTGAVVTLDANRGIVCCNDAVKG